jgi:hypothetical protein
MPDPAPIEELPSIHEVDEADNQLGSFLSDLDHLVSTVKTLAGGDLSLEEATRLVEVGKPLPHHHLHIDPAVFARLLVFADELERVAQSVKKDAGELRFSLLSLYRFEVIEKGGPQPRLS